MSDTVKLSVIFDMPQAVDAALLELQDGLAEKLENIKRQEDDFHVTVAVADDIDNSRIKEIVDRLKKTCEGMEVALTVGPVKEMVTHAGEGVVYLKADNDLLFELNKKVQQILKEYGGIFSYPEFKGHVTLFYLSEPATEKQKEMLKDFLFKETVILSPQHLRISVKNGKDWERIGRLKLAKRDLI